MLKTLVASTLLWLYWQKMIWTLLWFCNKLPFLKIIVHIHAQVLFRDVSVPLFGGIPLFFFFLLSAFLKITFHFFWNSLFSFTLCPLSPSQHTHTHTHTHTYTHTHTHTHTLLILLSGHHQGTHTHCNCITLFFLLFFFWNEKTWQLFVLFIHLSIYLPIYLSIYLLVYLLIYSFVCLFTWKMSFLPPGILHRFLCLHNYAKKKAFFLYIYFFYTVGCFW